MAELAPVSHRAALMLQEAGTPYRVIIARKWNFTGEVCAICLEEIRYCFEYPKGKKGELILECPVYCKTEDDFYHANCLRMNKMAYDKYLKQPRAEDTCASCQVLNNGQLKRLIGNKKRVTRDISSLLDHANDVFDISV